MTIRIGKLIEDLSTRSARAIVSQLGVRSDTLRRYLSNLYTQSPGSAGSLLADPVFEGTFGWALAGQTMEYLAKKGLLSHELISALDSPPVPYRQDYAFPRTRQPYRHQVDSWRLLLEHDVPQSVLVASGTGSGKTECFLIPILEDLVRERAKAGHLTGVRALFLYPLNALINSQRDRLRAWCNGFGQDIRFALYNGETREHAPAHEQKGACAEQISRKQIREDPPPVLVTNATMLEYMLIRTQDQPIVDASKGQLRWIVLDEAHTYIGSNAAEIALLLRRVLHRFGVDPADVRFVATSATISDGDAASEPLQRFLADVSGAPLPKVHVVTGERFVPPIPPKRAPNPTSKELRPATGNELFHALCNHTGARLLRQRLALQPERLTDLAGPETAGGTVELLELASIARRGDEVFLPLRVHLFHRGQRGLWACANRECDGLQDTDLLGWGHGAIYVERRTRCQHCGYGVFELVTCSECAQHYLMAQETFCGEDEDMRLAPWMETVEVDEFELEVEADDEDEGPPQPVSLGRRLICGDEVEAEHIDAWKLDREGRLMREGEGTRVRLSRYESSLACPRCRAVDRVSAPLFRAQRIGAPFALSTIVPTALEHAPSMARGQDLPSQGRRLLGFSDSRQGSARLAVRLQQEAERNRVRSVLYHALAEARPASEGPDRQKLEEQVNELRLVASSAILRALLKDKEHELARMKSIDTHGVLSWTEAAAHLKGDSGVRRMYAYFQALTRLDISLDEYASFCLYREFFRRPKRMNSAETMGLVRLRYPELGNTSPPAGWPLDPDDWTSFLEIVVDYFLRNASAVWIPRDDYLRWMGVSLRQRYVQGPGYLQPLTRRQRRWPSAGPGGKSKTRVVQLLWTATGLPRMQTSADRINEAFNHAWATLRPLLRNVGDGFLFDLEKSHLCEVGEAAVCPYTGKVLSSTLHGLSPYRPVNGDPETCEVLRLPRLPKAFWRDSVGAHAHPAEIADWLDHDNDLQEARRLGVWSNLNDRIAANAPYYEAAEHSAQIGGHRLRALEARFQDGEVNVLSCSTTMEMGVDIGGLSVVVMSNAPPSAANYRQRAGRTGRRGESVSLAVTLCPTSPHGEQVFNNPLWPFRSKVNAPRVSLQSQRLVYRHVNSLCFGTFLARMVRDGTHKLKSGWFFLPGGSDESTPAESFVDWCRTTAEEDGSLRKGLERLVRRTALEQTSIRDLLERCYRSMQRVRGEWCREWSSLMRDADQFGDLNGTTKAPALLAIARQLKRLENEYLLSDLANRQFLPGHGFPTGIVCFVPDTIEDLKRGSSTNAEREESYGKRAGYPSRQLEMAIREYAPGGEVVIDGRVHESGGVTLHWHLPPDAVDATGVSEAQAIRFAWRCRKCGATGDTASLQDTCSQCQGAVETQRYLEPAGFAVDIRSRPHNNVASPTFVPVEQPWISCPTPDWRELPSAASGRFRYSDSGHLFHGSRGVGRHGYAICLRCGRAESEEGPADRTVVPQNFREPHSRLRGGRASDGSSECDGSGFAIQRGLALGGSRFTDVFELQLDGLVEEGVAWSIGIALRHAFARRLGIEDQEVGVAVRPSTTHGGTMHRSIFLYDIAEGGSGYVEALQQDITGDLGAAKEVLDCVKGCDSSCHACLLSFGTQYLSQDLNRHDALAFLSAFTQ